MAIFLQLSIFLCVMSMAICYSHSKEFLVGGREGWVHNPSESYNHWAERMRFHVHDTLVFRYKEGEESVLVVSREDYYSCNTSRPIQKLQGGNSEFKLERSGPFFFISGKQGSCERGHKLVVVVMTLRSPPPLPSNHPLPSPAIPNPPPPSQAPSDELPSSPSTPGTIPPSSSDQTSPSSPTSSAQSFPSYSFEFFIGYVLLRLLAALLELV